MPEKEYLTTDEFAESLGVKGSTARRGLCVKGHYMGVVPLKMPNNRLLWPTEQRNRLLQRSNAA